MKEINIRNQTAVGFVQALSSGLLVLLCLCACSSQPSSQERMQAVRDSSRPRAAVVGMDNFWLDYRSPGDKPVDHWEFYFKHCTLQSRKPYMDEAEYMCTNPY